MYTKWPSGYGTGLQRFVSSTLDHVRFGDTHKCCTLYSIWSHRSDCNVKYRLLTSVLATCGFGLPMRVGFPRDLRFLPTFWFHFKHNSDIWII